MIRRRALLQQLGVATTLWPFRAALAQPAETLKTAAAKCGILFGSNSEIDLPTGPAAYRNLFLEQCALFAANLNWKLVAPVRDSLTPPADGPNIGFAQEHGLKLTGAHLLWFEALPRWFTSLGDPIDAQSAVLAHIHRMTERYRGRIYSWNVVNEALQPSDGRPDGLRQTPLVAKLGADFFDIAFRAARSGDPDAFLVYNDYNLEMDRPDQEQKRNALLRLLDRFARDGTPLDAVGLQSHLALDGSRFDEKKYRAFLAELASRGLKIMITELDVLDTDAPTEHGARDAAVADLYARFLPVALDELAVMSVVTWGLSDRYTWLVPNNSPKFVRKDGEPIRPLPFDADFAPKPAFTAMLNAFDHAPTRPLIQRPPARAAK